MEKILKKYLIFTLILPFLFIKNVYAEEYNIYNAIQYNFYSWNSYPESYVKYNYSFNAYDMTFKVNHNFVDNYVNLVLYDKVNDLYLIGAINTNSPSNVGLQCSSYKYFSYCLINDNWASLNVNSPVFYASLSLKNENEYWSEIFPNQNIRVNKKDDFYITQVNLKGWDNVGKYIQQHENNFELVYSSVDKIYINDLEIPFKSSSSEEPEEPEDPPTPPFNFNNNKYYVPNYHTGQCVEILDKDTIRVFEDEFTDFYTDYYINSNYISKTGQVDIDYEKNCSSLEFTDIRYYGNDLPQILFILICVLTFTIGFPYVLYKRFRKR